MNNDLGRILYTAIRLLDSGQSRKARELLADMLRDNGAVVREPPEFPAPKGWEPRVAR